MMALEVIPAKAGIQTSSLRKQGTIIKWNWILVFTGNPGFRIKCGMTLRGRKHPAIALQDIKMLISTEISRRYNASRQHPDRVNL
jgi:hypothetical protein